MFKSHGIAIAILAISLVSACASNPDKMVASDVSPLQYRKYDCEQIAEESQRISRKVNSLHGQLKKKSDNDATQMAVGAVLFWPTLFFLEGGDGADAIEYKQLKGEYNAIQEAIIRKKCSFEKPEIKEAVKKETIEDKKKQSTDEKPL